MISDLSLDHDGAASKEVQKYVALLPNHEKLGNQLFQLAAGYGIARTLNRKLYYPLGGQAVELRCHLKIITAAFPKAEAMFEIIPRHSIKQTAVPFAVDERGQRTCCRFDDPLRFVDHPAKYLLLLMRFAQNSRYFEDYLPDLRRLFSFSTESRQMGERSLRRLNIGNATDFMCVHIRRKDFVEFGVESDAFATLRAVERIALIKGLSDFLIFGDDRKFMRNLALRILASTRLNKKIIRISEFSEIADLYVSSRLCRAFLMSASSSTFGWWLAFFAKDQDSVFYYKSNKPTIDYKLFKDEFHLRSWHRYSG